MSSAAVIGRQLRQQQSSSRIVGPVVPPTQYKGSRPQVESSSVQLQLDSSQLERDSLPSLAYTQTALLGADADKKFAQFSQLYSHEFYPHPAHRNNSKNEKFGRPKEKKKKEPRIQLSWHCFCVALKALSSGIVLLLAGTVMSVVGFFADTLSQQNVQLNNGTTVTTINADLKTHLHNLTYVGPVIMGLGGIVIVAACVLTFEVRDTLGVKIKIDDEGEENSTSPPHTEKSDLEINLQQLNSSSLSSQNAPKWKQQQRRQQQQNASSNHSNGEGRSKGSGKRTTNETNSKNLSKQINFSEKTQQQRHQSSKQFNLKQNAPKCSQTNGVGGCGELTTTESIKFKEKNDARLRCAAAADQKPFATTINNNNGKPHSVSDQNIFDLSFVRIPSPQETELSDPEGCSLNNYYNNASNLFSRCKSRCSCSGSPTNSMLFAALQSANDWQQSSLSNLPFVSQLPNRHSKILASVESDGLSSSTSSDWDDMMQYRVLSKTQQQQQQNLQFPVRLTNRDRDHHHPNPHPQHYRMPNSNHRHKSAAAADSNRDYLPFSSSAQKLNPINVDANNKKNFYTKQYEQQQQQKCVQNRSTTTTNDESCYVTEPKKDSFIIDNNYSSSSQSQPTTHTKQNKNFYPLLQSLEELRYQ